MPSAARRAPAPADNPALRTPAAARFLGRAPNTLYKWRQETKEKGRQIGPVWHVDENGVPYYLMSDLLDFRRQRRIAEREAERRRAS